MVVSIPLKPSEALIHRPTVLTPTGEKGFT